MTTESEVMLPLLTTSQLAETLQVPTRTLEYWRYRGVGPKYYPIGKSVRYRQGDVEDWLEQLSVGENPGQPLS